MLVELLQRLFKNDFETNIALAGTTPYIQICQGEAILVIRCPDLPSLQLLKLLSVKLVAKIEPLLGYGIYLECLEYVKDCPEEKKMVSVLEQEQSVTHANGTEVAPQLINLEKLATALREPLPKVKLMLARQGAAVYPQENGTEAIAESIFDALILRWAKSIKEELVQVAEHPGEPIKTRKVSTRLLTKELTNEDIARTKNGRADLTDAGIQFTFEKFANSLNLEDSSLTDAISAFIEGTSEFGKKLRKKLIAYYKKFTPTANLVDVEAKLVKGAKSFLETISASEETVA